MLIFRRNQRFVLTSNFGPVLSNSKAWCCLALLLHARNELCDRLKKRRTPAENRAYNRLPENVARRKAAYARFKQDPIRIARRKADNAKVWKDNRVALHAQHKAWQLANREKVRTYMRDYVRHKRRTDPQVNIGNRLRSRMWHALAECSKSASTEALTGCSLSELKRHIQYQFTVGMTWELFLNGRIHLDHKQPCCTFDLRDPDQQRLCFHYTNIQPLWAEHNQSKGGKINWTVPETAPTNLWP